MKRYFVRALKFSLYFLAILLIFLLFMHFMSNGLNSEKYRFSNIFANGNLLWMLLIIVAFGAIYPFFGFVSVRIPMNKKLDEEKPKLVELFDLRKYQLISDDGKLMTFRPKSKLNRITRMNEDFLEIDYSNTTLKVSGLRKDVYRFKRPIEEFAQVKEV